MGIDGLVTSTMGLGILISQEKSGVFNSTSIEINYSYRLQFLTDHSVAFGISGGLSQNKLDLNDITITDNTDPTLNSNKVNESLINAGFGIHYNWKDLTIGLSSPLIYGTQENVFLQTGFAFTSYDFYFSNDLWHVQPSVLYRHTKASPSQVDINTLAEWDSKLWGLVGYRTNKNILLGGGIYLKNIGIGYSYEINRSLFSSFATGSHEIILSFESPYSITKKASLYKKTKRRPNWF